MKCLSLISKKALTISSSTVLCTLALGSSVFAAQSESSKLIDLDDNNLTLTYETDANINVKAASEAPTEDNCGIEPLLDYLSVNNESVQKSGSKWDQPKGYASYRVHVTNTQSQPMTVTVKYFSGSAKSWSFVVPANDYKTYVVNNAVATRHDVEYTSKNGTISGRINVRVSDLPLS